jgi:hypothetical protein
VCVVSQGRLPLCAQWIKTLHAAMMVRTEHVGKNRSGNGLFGKSDPAFAAERRAAARRWKRPTARSFGLVLSALCGDRFVLRPTVAKTWGKPTTELTETAEAPINAAGGRPAISLPRSAKTRCLRLSRLSGQVSSCGRFICCIALGQSISGDW